MPQEQETGAKFYVTIQATAEIDDLSVKEDDINGVVDYSALTHIVQDEMAQPSKLMEHVAQRIGQRIMQELNSIKSANILIEKENPPLGISVEGLGVQLNFCRS